MTLIQRIGYYLGGFSIGLIVLAFFLNGKRASCSYGPESRVLKNINSKKITYSNLVLLELANKKIDSSVINHILKSGDINFSKSNVQQKPCGIYLIEGSYKKKEIVLAVENCDSIATILNLKSD